MINETLDEAKLRILCFVEKEDVILKEEVREMGAGCSHMDRFPLPLLDNIVNG